MTGPARPADPRCGSYAGAMAHKHRREPCCDTCRPARARYQARWRDAHPGANAAYLTRLRQAGTGVRRRR